MSLSSIATAFGGAAISGFDQALFQTALANLNWSRGYLWYVTLSDVPNPFQASGVIKLPVTEVTYEISDPKEFTWEGATQTFAAPQRKGLCTVNLTMYDDEQGTMYTFFERWYNFIYNDFGVIPLSEATRLLRIVKLKSTRRPVTREYTTYSEAVKKSTDRTLEVYPSSPLQEVLNSDSGPRQYQIKFTIVNQLNDDNGNPAKSNNAILDRVADYI